MAFLEQLKQFFVINDMRTNICMTCAKEADIAKLHTVSVQIIYFILLRKKICCCSTFMIAGDKRNGEISFLKWAYNVVRHAFIKCQITAQQHNIYFFLRCFLRQLLNPACITMHITCSQYFHCREAYPFTPL